MSNNATRDADDWRVDLIRFGRSASLDGLSPETIASEGSPELTLEQVYGAITFYLSNREHINARLQRSEVEFEDFQQASSQSAPAFGRQLTSIRHQALIIS